MIATSFRDLVIPRMMQILGNDIEYIFKTHGMFNPATGDIDMTSEVVLMRGIFVPTSHNSKAHANLNHDDRNTTQYVHIILNAKDFTLREPSVNDTIAARNKEWRVMSILDEIMVTDVSLYYKLLLSR